MRDGIRWHLVERRAFEYDWSSFVPMPDAAQRCGVQVVWDLCHYGWPDDVDVWRPQFVERFAAFARAAAQVVRDHDIAQPFYCPVNEISYLAWAGGEVARINPMGIGRGLELKHQLVRATIAAIRAIREVEPRARFVQVDPLVHIRARGAEHEEEAAARRRAQFDG